MTDRTPPDSLPPLEQDHRSDIEQVVESRDDDVEHAEDGETTSPLDPAVSPDTAGGSGGVVRNQDDTAQ